MTAILKDGSLVADWYLSYVKTLQCSFCWNPACDPHHFPPKGRSGVRRDDLTCPVCRVCHDRCAGETMVIDGRKLGPIGEEQQADAVARTWRHFWSTASPLMLLQMAREVIRWRESRGEAVPA